MKTDIPDLAPHDVCVNLACLLQLFQQCGGCGGQCDVRKQGDAKHFSLNQHCQLCNLVTTWTSQPFKEEEESVDLCEATEKNQDFTASLTMREWFDDGKTDTTSSREQRLWTDEVRKIITTDVAEADDLVVLPCEVREGKQESTAAMAAGSASRETNLWKTTADSDLSVESQRSQDDSGGEEEENGEEMEKEKRRLGKEEEEVSRKEASPLTDGDIKMMRPAKQMETEESGSLPCEARGEVQESTVSMTTTIGSQTDGRPGRKKRLLEDSAKVEKTKESVHESSMSQEDNDGGEERVERRWVENNNVKKEMEEASSEYEESDVYGRIYRRAKIIKQVQERSDSTLCTDCGRVYRTLTHKCDPKAKFQCSDCGLFFLTEQSFGYHTDGNCRSRSDPCVFCLKSFKTRQEKLIHEMSHSADDAFPYECPECPELFPDRATRTRHLREEHPMQFRCQTCQKEFPLPFLLKRHELTHSANKPFKCQMCDRAFAQASQLKSHERVHTGEKPFKCKLCPKCFNHNISLKTHMRRYHPGESLDSPAPGGS